MADEKDPAREYYGYLKEWAQRDDKQRALRPKVNMMLGTATWQIDAMDTLRAESPGMARELEDDIRRALADLKVVMPLPIDYLPTAELASSVTTTQANTQVFDALISMRGSEPQSLPELITQITKYEELTTQQLRPEEAKRRVGLVFPDLSERFGAVQDAVQGAVNQFSREAAALEMRTFLDKLKGELFSKARRNMGENMNWDLMAERLSDTAAGRRVLRDQGSTHASLTNTLSNLGKARPPATFGFDEAWTRFVDHVFIVCGQVLASASEPGDG